MKSILITGVSSGIGEACAEHFAYKGWKVFGTVRKIDDAKHLKDTYPNFVAIVYDVKDIAGISIIESTLLEHLGETQLDVLINNAGIAVGGPMEELTEEEFEEQLDVNIKSVRRITNAVLPRMKNPEIVNKIINISSVSGFMTSPFLGAYCISKHGLEAMTDAYRRELLPFNVDVISIQPGPIKTPIWRKSAGVYDKYKDSSYGPYIPGIERLISKNVAQALPVSEVVAAVDKAVNSQGGATRYLVAKGKATMYMIKNFFPPRWIDNVIGKSIIPK